MILNLVFGTCLLSLIISLITLNYVCGLKKLIAYELSNFEAMIKQRISAFLDVFRKSKNL
jgi:hypothetical protein